MLAQPPIPLATADKIAALGARVPMLLMWQPSRHDYKERDWDTLKNFLASRGAPLPAIELPADLIAILRQATGECIVYVSKTQDQWAYLSVLSETLPGV
jgi:hypothetical protein